MKGKTIKLLKDNLETDKDLLKMTERTQLKRKR